MPNDGTTPPAATEPGPPGRFVVSVTLFPADRFHEYLCEAPPPRVGTPVVIETERGVCLGWVRRKPHPASAREKDALPSLVRVASEGDLLQEDRNREREIHAFRVCVQLIQRHSLVMKLVKVHYLLGGAKAVFYFTADGRVDFRALVRDLAAELRVRIEMRQIGVRDETKMCGGVGHCGRQLCCSGWLRNFVPVSIRMAKDQNLALNPQKVSGACGRLMCCLAYEHENYVAMRRGLPKVGKRTKTVHGSGRVVSVEVLKERMTIELDEGGRLQVGRDELVVPQGPAGAVGGDYRQEQGSSTQPAREVESSRGDPPVGAVAQSPAQRPNSRRSRRGRRRRQSRSEKP